MCKEDACLQNGGVNERLEYADMAYTVRVERGIALGWNDRSGNMAV